MDSDFEEIPFRVSSWGTLRDIPFLASLLSSNRIFLGGGLLREFLGYTVLDPKKTDIDLFFQDAETYHATKEWFEREPSVEKIYQCPEDKLATYLHKETGWKYQCIAVSFYPTLFEVVDSFDFVSICIGIDGERMLLHKDCIEDNKNRQLRWHKITYPSASLKRLMKYARKGYSMGEAEYQYFVDCCWNRSEDIFNKSLVYVD